MFCLVPPISAPNGACCTCSALRSNGSVMACRPAMGMKRVGKLARCCGSRVFSFGAQSPELEAGLGARPVIMSVAVSIEASTRGNVVFTSRSAAATLA